MDVILTNFVGVKDNIILICRTDHHEVLNDIKMSNFRTFRFEVKHCRFIKSGNVNNF